MLATSVDHMSLRRPGMRTFLPPTASVGEAVKFGASTVPARGAAMIGSAVGLDSPDGVVDCVVTVGGPFSAGDDAC